LEFYYFENGELVGSKPNDPKWWDHGYLVTWLPGYPVTLVPGYLDTGLFGYLVTQWSKIQGYGDPVTMETRAMEINACVIDDPVTLW
jgi:hypothetical protein